jgi:glutamyl-tRNA reductase
MRKPQLVCLGLSHQTASVELREQTVCTLDDLRVVQRALDLRHDGAQHFSDILEFALLSTCNRFELYAVVKGSVVDARSLLLQFATATTMVDPDEVNNHIYWLEGMEVAEHLARVAAGIESLVLGESQILGQVSRAYSVAVSKHTLGPILDATLRMGIRVGKRVHAETIISSGSVSISSVAVGTAESVMGPLSRRSVLVVGLGQMGIQTLKALRGRGVSDIILANRTHSRAERLAKEQGMRACALAELPDALRSADVVISATGAPGFLIDRKMVEEAQRQRGERPLLLIDIAVPRDIDPATSELLGVRFFGIDHLNRGVDDALALRQAEIPRADAIVADECTKFEAEMRRLAVEPVVADFRLRAEEMRKQELDRTLRFIGPDLDKETRDHIQHLTHALVNKLLHEPTIRLKEKAAHGEAEEFLPAFQDLFGLPATNGYAIDDSTAAGSNVGGSQPNGVNSRKSNDQAASRDSGAETSQSKLSQLQRNGSSTQ